MTLGKTEQVIPVAMSRQLVLASNAPILNSTRGITMEASKSKKKWLYGKYNTDTFSGTFVNGEYTHIFTYQVTAPYDPYQRPAVVKYNSKYCNFEILLDNRIYTLSNVSDEMKKFLTDVSSTKKQDLITQSISLTSTFKARESVDDTWEYTVTRLSKSRTAYIILFDEASPDGENNTPDDVPLDVIQIEAIFKTPNRETVSTRLCLLS
jgi:hypothetical protein